jgi:dTDP-4-amino-4,6-dideoxygalactose transaminase
MILTSASIEIPFVDLQLQHQPIQAEIEQAIQNVIKNGDFILGQALTEFETAFANACGVKYGVGVASGTDAIALGLKACGVGEGDEVIVPCNTFIATVIGAIEAGAKPILVDCHPDTALIDLEAAAKAVTKKTKAIVPVHLYGQMVAPSALLDFARTYNLIVFEDAAQAHLAQREGYFAGAVGMAAAFSFYPSKNLGAFGAGGMVVTNDEAIATKIKTIRNYGAHRKYYHTELGVNSRLDTIQAAILNVKLPHLSQWNYQRNCAAKYYNLCLEILQNKGIFPITNQCDAGHVYHLYVINLGQFGGDSLRDSFASREAIQEKLAIRGIQTAIHYPIPCHLQPAYQFLGYRQGDFPVAEALSAQILSLPIYPGLVNDRIEIVCDSLVRLCQ